MRKSFLILLSLLTAALIGPPVFLGIAAVLDSLGFPSLAHRVERLPFDSSIVHFSDKDKAATASVWLMVTIGTIIAALIFIACLRVCFRRRHGGRIVAVCGVLVMPVYIYLVWDEASVELRPEMLQPRYGSARIPREIVLEATNDPTFGQAKDWPRVIFEYHKETPATEWLLANAEQIRSRWAQLQPVRTWAARLDAWPTFDDYMDKPTDPILSFLPLRQMTMGAQEFALLCSAEGKPEEAAATLRETVRLGRRLEEGSRALVTLMIGAVIEKKSLRTLQILCERDPNSRELYRTALDGSQPMSPWEDLERTLLNEVSIGYISTKETYTGGKNLKDRAANYIIRLFINQNASTRIYQHNVEQVLASVKRQDFGSIDRMHAKPPGKSHKHYFKNPSGRYLARQGLPSYGKVAKSLHELATLRTQLSALTDVSSPAL